MGALTKNRADSLETIRKNIDAGPTDEFRSGQLALFATSDGALYKATLERAYENMRKRIENGTYDSETALVGLMPAIRVAAQHYEKGRVDWTQNDVPPWATPNVRVWAAKSVIDDFEAGYK